MGIEDAQLHDGEGELSPIQAACKHSFILLTTIAMENIRYTGIEDAVAYTVIGCTRCFVLYYNVENDHRGTEYMQNMDHHLRSNWGEETSMARHYFSRMRLFAQIDNPHDEDNDD